MISIKRFIVDSGTILVDVNLLVANRVGGGAHLQQISLELPFQSEGDTFLDEAVRKLVDLLEREVKGVLQAAVTDA